MLYHQHRGGGEGGVQVGVEVQLQEEVQGVVQEVVWAMAGGGCRMGPANPSDHSKHRRREDDSGGQLRRSRG